MVEQKDRFGELIGDALREETARCHLPTDFTRRLLRGVRNDGVPSCGGLPRWMKVAAAVAAMASFAAFASWVGVTVGRAVLSAPEQDESSTSIPSDPETEAISNQGENTMIARKMATLVGAAMVSVAVPAAEITSEPTFVFLKPETSSFWNTATNNTMTVPIDYPAGATSAKLAITGLGYQRDYLDITGVDEFSFELPTVTSPETENVYDLTLTFNDGTVRTAKLGLVQGLSPDSEGTTRCLAPAGSKVWKRVNGKAVLPIPYGMKTLKINGVDTDTGLDGAQGWYALGRIELNETVTLSGVAGDVEYAAELLGGLGGLILIFR